MSIRVLFYLTMYKNRYKKLGPRDAKKSDSMHLVFSASSGLKLLLLHLEFQKFSFPWRYASAAYGRRRAPRPPPNFDPVAPMYKVGTKTNQI